MDGAAQEAADQASRAEGVSALLFGGCCPCCTVERSRCVCRCWACERPMRDHTPWSPQVQEIREAGVLLDVRVSSSQCAALPEGERPKGAQMIEIMRQGLATLGFLKIGEPTDKGGAKRGSPIKHDHIEITTRERERGGAEALYLDVDVMRRVLASGVRTCGGCPRAKQLAKEYGAPEFETGLPVEIGIVLAHDDLELNLESKLAYHRGNTEFCRGNGKTAERRKVLRTKKIQTEKGGEREVPVLGDFEPFGPCGSTCPDFQARLCKPKGRFRFMLAVQQSVGGVFEFRTASWASLANLTNSLLHILQLTQGTLTWLPLRFEISAQTVRQKLGEGGPSSTAYIANVEFQGTPMELLERATRNLSLRAPMIAQIRQLEAGMARGWEQTGDEIRAYRSEFDPENLSADVGAVLDVSALPPPAPVPPMDPGADLHEADGGQPAPAPARAEPPPLPPAAPDEPERKINGEERMKLLDCCKGRARELKLEKPDSVGLTKVLKGAMGAHGVKFTDDITNTLYPTLFETARTWQP